MKLKKLGAITFAAIMISLSCNIVGHALDSNLQNENQRTSIQQSKISNGWAKDQYGSWVYYKNGVKQSDKWIKSSGKNYYVDAFGVMVSDCEYYINNKYYVFDKDGVCIEQKGWFKRNTTDKNGYSIEYWYYGNGNKTIKESNWVKDSGKWYYFDEFGRMLNNTVRRIDNKYYIFAKDGSIIEKKGWVKFNWSDGDGIWYTDWCYGNGDGTIASNKWVKDNDKWYYINDKFMVRNYSLNIDGKTYIFGNDGAMIEKYGWIKINYNDPSAYDWFYGNGDGTVKENQYIKDNNKLYYLQKGGYLQSSQNFDKSTQVKRKVATISTDKMEIRTKPNNKYPVVYEAGINQVVVIKEKNEDGWYKVELPNGVLGWCRGVYLANFKYFNDSTFVGISQSEIDKKLNSIVKIAKSKVGRPYVWAAVGPNKFDCSGLMLYSYKQGAGIELSDYSAEQAVRGRYIAKNELKKGDLLFFDTSGKGRVTHVGMYIGNGEFVHAANYKEGVKISKVNESKYSSKYICARRIIE